MVSSTGSAAVTICLNCRPAYVRRFSVWMSVVVFLQLMFQFC